MRTLLRSVRTPVRRAAAAALLLGVALPAASAQDFVFSVTFDGGGWFDRSFNEGTWRGLTRAVGELSDEYDIDVLIYDGSPDTSAEGQTNIASNGLDLMVAAGFLQVGAIETVSSRFPDSSFVLIDGVVDNPNVRSVLFKEHEGSYLAGWLAGTMTQTGVVGFVGGMDVPLIRAFALGYREGVEASCPTCIVLSEMVGPTPAAFNDPERAYAIAEAQQAQGADIIYAAAGNSGTGVIRRVNEVRCLRTGAAGIEVRPSPLATALAEIPTDAAYAAACGAGTVPAFFIGVDSNQNGLGDVDGDPSTLNHGLTSMLKMVDVAAYQAVQDVVSGTFRGGLQVLGLAEDGVALVFDEHNSALVPQEVRDRLAEVRAAIVAGRLEVPDYRELPEAQAPAAPEEPEPAAPAEPGIIELPAAPAQEGAAN